MGEQTAVELSRTFVEYSSSRRSHTTLWLRFLDYADFVKAVHPQFVWGCVHLVPFHAATDYLYFDRFQFLYRCIFHVVHEVVCVFSPNETELSVCGSVCPGYLERLHTLVPRS